MFLVVFRGFEGKIKTLNAQTYVLSQILAMFDSKIEIYVEFRVGIVLAGVLLDSS